MTMVCGISKGIKVNRNDRANCPLWKGPYGKRMACTIGFYSLPNWRISMANWPTKKFAMGPNFTYSSCIVLCLCWILVVWKKNKEVSDTFAAFSWLMSVLWSVTSIHTLWQLHTPGVHTTLLTFLTFHKMWMPFDSIVGKQLKRCHKRLCSMPQVSIKVDTITSW